MDRIDGYLAEFSKRIEADMSHRRAAENKKPATASARNADRYAHGGRAGMTESLRWYLNEKKAGQQPFRCVEIRAPALPVC